MHGQPLSGSVEFCSQIGNCAFKVLRVVVSRDHVRRTWMHSPAPAISGIC